MKRMCRRCALALEERVGLCPACRRYAWRNGVPRPSKVIERHADRLVRRDLDRRAR